MKIEQNIFLSLLRDYLNHSISPIYETEIDWEILYEYAKQQSLLGVCYFQLKKLASVETSITNEVLDKFHKGLFNDVYAAVNHKKGMEELTAVFQEKGIPFLTFKGWILKEYWPIPELRTMSDIDILVYPESREDSDTIMESLSYKKYIDNNAVWVYYKKDMIVEIHDHMFYEHLVNDIDYSGYFDQAWEYADSELKESFHFLYLIAHLAKHTINYGIGFRAFMDLIFYCNGAKDRMNWNWIHDELVRLKLLSFAETCLAFCGRWFDFESPLIVRQLDPNFFSFVTDKVFQDGNFGLENTQNDASRSAKEIAYIDNSYLVSAIKLTIHRIFPPYDEMRLVPWYSFIDGHPWMLPFAWIYRWGYCAVNKQERSKSLLEEPFAKKTVIEERQKLIQDWGL